MGCGPFADARGHPLSARVFLFGAGYSARAFATGIAGEAHIVGGTTRSAEKAEGLASQGIAPFIYGGGGFSEPLRAALQETTHLVVSIAPGESGNPVLADLAAASSKAMSALEWVAYLSTVGVYGDHGCAWVDEESECRPSSQRSRRRLEAEAAWTAFSHRTGVPVAILRLSGIYGPGRNAFVNLARGTAKRIIKPGQVFNRIHVADIAGATHHLMRLKAGGLYNVTDDEPAAPQDPVAFAAGLMGVVPPPEIPFDEADMKPMARSFYSECKRVSNARLKATGYHLRYPDYRTALQAMWDTRSWADETAVSML